MNVGSAVSLKAGAGASTVVVRVPAAMVPRRPRDQEAAARRGMAIQRLLAEEEGWGGDQQSSKEISLFSTTSGICSSPNPGPPSPFKPMDWWFYCMD